MKIGKTDRGFEILIAETYPKMEEAAILQQSSVVGPYEDSFDRPGSSFIWVGDNYHLNREQAIELATRLLFWSQTGSFKYD